MTDLDAREIRGPVLDLYGSLEVALRQIGETHPYAVKVQGWAETRGAVVEALRRRWPDVLLALCPGVDPIARRWRSHHDADRAVRELVDVARGCVALGIGTLVFDAEGEWKARNGAERVALPTIAREALSEIRERWPSLRLALTSYGWPVRVDDLGGHGDFPWAGWCIGPEVTFVGQTYDRGAGHLVAGERAAVESFHAAVERGLMAPGTRRFVEVQTHHNAVAELVTVGTSTDATFWWAAGSSELFDAPGSTAWRAALALWRGGFWGGAAVERFQATRGLKADGVCGPATLAALGVTS